MINSTYTIVGVTFKNEDKVKRQDLLGKIYDNYWDEDDEDEIAVELRREPDNPADPNAVGVWCVGPQEAAGRLGFIPGDAAPFVSQAILDKRLRGVRIVEMYTSGKSAKVGAKVRLKIAGDTDSPDEDLADESTDQALHEIEDAEGRVYEFE